MEQNVPFEFDQSIYSYHLPPFYRTTKGMLIIGGCVVLAAALIGLLVWWRTRKRPLTLKAWGQREVAALAKELRQDPVNYKRYFGAVTFFIKQYLHRLYDWPFIDKTDEEVKAFLVDKQEVPESLKGQFDELFSYAQMVKFADQAALAEKASDAQRILKNTLASLEVPQPTAAEQAQ